MFFSINGSNITLSPDGTQYTITLNVALRDPYNGSKYVWVDTYDNNGTASGWQFGNASFTMQSQDFAPQTISVSPPSGSGNVGAVQQFTITTKDTNGAYTLFQNQLVFNQNSSWVPGYDPRPRCKIIQDSTFISLESDYPNQAYVNGGYIPFGSSQTMSNSYCTVYPAMSSINANPDIQTTQITFAVAFTANFAGTVQDHIYAADNLGQATWDTQANETWTWNVARTYISGGGDPGPPDQATSDPDVSSPTAQSSSAQACQNLSGTWFVNGNPSETWTLNQVGNTVTGALAATLGGCNATWSVTGTATNGVTSLTASQPTPCPSYIVEANPITANFTVAGCSTTTVANETYNFPSYTDNFGQVHNANSQTSNITWSRTSAIPGVQTTIDLTNDRVNVILSGATQRNLTLTLSGTSDTRTLAQSSNLGAGSYSFSLGRQSLATTTYTSLSAQWGDVGLTIPIAINPLGFIRYSQYNIPKESLCSTTLPTPVFVFLNNRTCDYWEGDTLPQVFVTQTNLNGTGTSNSYGLIKPYSATSLKNTCVLPPFGTSGRTDNTGNTFVVVQTATGSCNTTLSSGKTIAVNPAPTRSGSGGQWNCGDKVLLIGSDNSNVAVKNVQDYCPGCYTDFRGANGHIDSFIAQDACGGHSIGDVGNFQSIKVRQ